jgi:phosphoglycolate phosphatase
VGQLQTGIIFDLDGTLIDSTDVIVETMNRTRVDSGFSVLDRNSYESLIGLPALTLLEDLQIPLLLKLDLLTDFRTLLRAEMEHGVKIFSGVVELLTLLQTYGYKLGIATSKPTDLAEFTVSKSELHLSRLSVQGTDGFPAKPSPDVLFHCMRRMNCKNFIMVGDRIEDMKASMAAGIKSIGVAQTSHTIFELTASGASLALKSVDELFLELQGREESFFDNL